MEEGKTKDMSSGASGYAAITTALQLLAGSYPERTPLCVDGKAWLSYGEWDARSNAVARTLIDRGVHRGDRVGLLFAGLDWIDYAIGYFGVLKAGATATHLCDLLGQDELRRRLEQARACGVIHGSELPVPDFFGGWSLTVGEADRGGYAPVGTRIEPDDIADILYTSGTTGPAKPFLNPHGNLSFGRGWGAQAEAIFDLGAPLLSPLPVGTAYSASTAGVFALVTTAPIIVCLPGDVERMAGLIEQYRVASAMLRPLAAMRMAAAKVADRHDLSSVSVIGVASGGLPPRHARELQAMMPGARIMTGYGGGSEAVPAHLRTIYVPDRPQNMGRAQPGTDLLVVDQDGRPVPDGQLGEIWLRTQAPPRRYLDARLNERVFVGGWVRTGDLGRVDEGGELEFFDRGQDVLRRNGKLVSSLGIENALYEHPAVDEAAVVGIPALASSQRFIAAVTLNPEFPAPAPGELRAFAAERLLPEQVPDAVHTLAALPRSPVSEKILKATLRERFALAQASTAS